MQALILAAGMGKRLGELTEGNTKCMIKVNGITLIDRVLTQLSNLNLTKVIIVVGYRSNMLKEYIGNSYNGMPVEYVDNAIYNKTNNIYSLYLAKDYLLQDDTLLLESDIIMDDAVLQKAAHSTYQNLALIAKYESWMDGTMVTIDQDHNIINFIPKKLFDYSEIDSYYKTVNIYKFSPKFARERYIPFLEAYSKAFGNNEYYEQVLRVLSVIDKEDLKGVTLENEKWYEIDDVQDLDIAETVYANDSQLLKKYNQRYGGYWRFNKLLDFCYLVNPFFPTERMKDELKSNFDILLTEYPSGLSVNNLLAGKYVGVSKDLVIVGNGAAELIKALMTHLSGNIGVIYPTFEEYPNRYDREQIVAYIPQNDNFTYTSEDLINYFSDKQISSLLLINPDNPSGNFLSEEDVFSLLDWCKIQKITLIIDESFVDFVKETKSLLDNKILTCNPNLVVIKSISKSYGVPGLRLGVLATSNNILLNRIRKDLSIWNINSFAEYYMQIFSKYEVDYKNACKLFIAERERFFSKLKQIKWLRVIPSQANYFLCEVTANFTSTQLTELLLKEYNILIKDCSTKNTFGGKNYVRIAVRNEIDNDLLIQVLLALL